MKPLYSLLFTIDLWIIFWDVVALMVFAVIAVKNKKWNSSLLTLIAVVCLSGAMMLYAPYLHELYKDANDDLKKGLTFAWYCGFAIIDMVAMLSIFLLHQCFKIDYSVIAKRAIDAYFVLALLQMLNYAELIAFNTGFTNPLYDYGIPAISYTMTAMIIGVAICAVFSRYHITFNRWVIKWAL